MGCWGSAWYGIGFGFGVDVEFSVSGYEVICLGWWRRLYVIEGLEGEMVTAMTALLLWRSVTRPGDEKDGFAHGAEWVWFRLTGCI